MLNNNGKNKEVFFHGFMDSEIYKMKLMIDWVKDNYKKIPENSLKKLTMQGSFWYFFNEHDRRRNTNFVETFPELKEFYNNCELLTKGES
jgi:hypothetical protein